MGTSFGLRLFAQATDVSAGERLEGRPDHATQQQNAADRRQYLRQFNSIHNSLP
jgi:hypothetical protein